MSIEASQTTLRWFGPYQPQQHGESTQVQTPVGAMCGACETPIEDEDQGWTLPGAASTRRSSWHHECLLQAMGI